MIKRTLLKSMLLLCALVAGVSSMWATSYISYNGNTQDKSTTISSSNVSSGSAGNISWTGIGCTYSSSRVNIEANGSITFTASSGLDITKIVIVSGSSESYYGTWTSSPSVTPTSSSGTTTFDGLSANSVTVTTSTAFRCTSASSIKIYYAASSSPSISADNVNITYNATSGSLAYTISNGVDGGAVTSATVTSSTPSGWLTVSGNNPYSSPIGLTCEANATATVKTATVQLTYTYDTNKTVTKDVTVTQVGKPNFISEITATSTAYTVVGTVVATNKKGFVIGDGTGYVYTYLNAEPSQAIKDKVKIAGTTGTYGQIIQFTNTATITTETSSSYDGTPAVTIITAVPDYSSDLHLSTYLQFEGALSKTSSNYFITLGESQIQISYPTSAQETALTALDGKKVRVKGYFTGINSSSNFTVMLESVEEVTGPTISVDPTTATAFTYIVDNGPSDDQIFTVTGTNLTSADITAAVSSDYEITDNTVYSSSVTIANGDIVSVRLKAGLAKGIHNGTLTLSTSGATDVVINLSGTVTGQIYTINVDDALTGGTIEADLASAEEGTTVKLTAKPDAAYTFGSWTVYKDDLSTEVTVTDNQFTMPNCEVYVSATFNAKPTYAVTCVASPVVGGTFEASPASAYKGQKVTLSYLAETGYDLSSIVITKTSDGSATDITPTVSGEDYIFNMPDYAVTATATFESKFFDGSFAKVTSTSALEDGGYYVLYSTKAMNSTVTSGKMGATAVTINNNIIENPDKSIVWKLVKNGDNWDLYNEKEGKYCYIEGTNTSAFKMATTASYHYAVTAYATGGGFKFKSTHSDHRGISYGNDNFGSYADSNDPTVYLYKYTTLTERTITFNGNGGTYNTATTYTQTVYDGVEATLDANQFTRSGYEFIAWNNQADGNGASSYDDGDKISVTGGALTLYAQWAQLHTLTIDNAIVGGSVEIEGNLTSSIQGVDITLKATPTVGHKFSAWNVYKAGDTSTKVTVTDNKFNMPDYNVFISATFEEVQTYSLVTDINDIVSGKHFIIASGTNGTVKAMGEQKDNNRAAVDVTATNGIIPETTDVYEFVIFGPDANGYYTIYDETNNKYLYAASSNSNYLKTRDTNTDNNGKWTIEVANTGIATIKAQGTYTRNWIRNNGNIFSCYASGQSDVYLYEKDGETTPSVDVTLASSGYASYCSPMALDLTPTVDYAAYAVTATSGSTVTFTKINGAVPAEMPFILYGENYGGQTVTLSAATGAVSAVAGNMLVGTLAPTAITTVSGDYTNFALSGGSFVKINDGTIPANKAYLPILTSNVPSSNARLTIVFADESTGIATVKSVQLNETVYNLRGQRVDNPVKGGLYIVGGKKVIMK